ncbi:class II aldolase/adducin family protein [Rhabdothermincola salaria]|uniref:class II aldolase/adducin family protein n=1 Tax=Rhabdothermincola salaria TaxID=2903142 RepID=UPI001E555DAA|nr:class II aldolase/adducin family protein [Rhabdothermincola salaria]MCD9622957.1 class II aldolase/adducin family protein [Rhabdothermincola salaria]
MDIDDIRFRIAAGRRILYREGCDSNVGGHVSARAEEDDGFWVTGFEYLDQTVPDGVVKLDFDLNPLVGHHELSPAVNFHALIYRTRPDVNAVVHVHSHHISVLSSIEGQTVGMYNVLSVLFHDDQATYFDDGIKAHTDVVEALGDKRVVLMKNHGAIVASDSVENAVIEAITLEKAAQYHLECVAVGGTEIAEAEVLGGKAMYRKHYLPQVWRANLDRIRGTDPDLFALLDD